MTDKDLIKALECCNKDDCDNCPYKRNCKNVMRDILDLITRQQAEIDDLTERLDATIAGQETLQKALAEKDREVEHLNKEVDRLSQCVLYHDGHSEDAKSEAIIEFAQRLKSLVNQHHYMLANIHNSRDFGMFTVGFEQAIDNIVKEMVGDSNE